MLQKCLLLLKTNILFHNYVYFTVGTIASSVDSTKKVAERSIDTGKAYVDSAKGKNSTC